MKRRSLNDWFAKQRYRGAAAEKLPQGTRVELINMNDPYTKLKPGDHGTVSMVDDTGTIFVNWDCGSGLGVVYGEDHIRKI